MTKTNKNNKTRKNKKEKVKIIKNKTNKRIQRISIDIANDLRNGRAKGIKSYTPTINQELISLKSIPRDKVVDCNNNKAFELSEPLKIAIRGKFFGKSCFKYNTQEAKEWLLHNLSANKHVDPNVIIPPIQSLGNCWFNTMFVTLFISDKGRKFFHYFRELMIKGKQSDGTVIPEGLANAFALLNFAIESSLTGSQYAYKLDTNSIIKQIYNSIPEKYHEKFPYIVKTDEASNPIQYYGSIITYLHEKSLQLILLTNLQRDWESRVKKEFSKMTHLPHVVIFEIYDTNSKNARRPQTFKVGGAEYRLDSSVIRDTSGQHFCATITCEGSEMAYDGYSFHRLVPMKWKNKINMNKYWGFEGSNNSDGTPLQWSFLEGYQLLLYYRVK